MPEFDLAICGGTVATAADTFRADVGIRGGRAAAAAGGNTCVLSFALQIKGMSLRQCVEDYSCKAKGQCFIDVGFHLIITHPTAEVLGQELPALVKAGHTSFKVFMTYDDLVLNDRAA